MRPLALTEEERSRLLSALVSAADVERAVDAVDTTGDFAPLEAYVPGLMSIGQILFVRQHENASAADLDIIAECSWQNRHLDQIVRDVHQAARRSWLNSQSYKDNLAAEIEQYKQSKSACGAALGAPTSMGEVYPFTRLGR